MNKKEIKDLLMEMRTAQNERIVNYLLGRLYMLNDEEINEKLLKIGDDEASIKNFLEEEINKKLDNTHEEHIPINEMFTYGISGNCIHLHMPVDLHNMMSKNRRQTFNTVNYYLLDAIEKIKKLKDDRFYKLEQIDSIYMISPILAGSERKFLDSLDFETHLYKNKELKDEEFVKNNPETQLAIEKFGKDRNVGTAKIYFDKINTKEWQAKKDEKKHELEEKGVLFIEESITKE